MVGTVSGSTVGEGIAVSDGVNVVTGVIGTSPDGSTVGTEVTGVFPDGVDTGTEVAGVPPDGDDVGTGVFAACGLLLAVGFFFEALILIQWEFFLPVL